MSLATEKLDVVKVIDSRVDFPKWAMPVREGGNTISYLSADATSTGNTIQFAITPPNPGGSVLGRDILIYNKITFTLVGDGGAGKLLVNLGASDAPRAYPWTSCIDTMTVQINNETITQGNWSQIGHVLRRFNPRATMYKLSNFCPWFPDQSASYSAVYASGRNVLSAGSAGDFDFLRGAYARITAPTNTRTNATVVLETYEPLNLAPFLFGSKAPGIPFVANLQLTFNASNYMRALSRAVGVDNVNAFTSASAVCSGSRIFYQSIAVPLLEGSIPRQVSLPFYKLAINTSVAQTIASAVPTLGTTPAGDVMQSQVISYNCIPSRIYVFAQPVINPATDYDVPDFTYQYCGGLNVQWGSRTALMTSVGRETLYSQAVDSGLSVPWEQFDGVYRLTTGSSAGGSGSVLCIRPGVDFDLAPGEVSGMQGSWQFQVSARFNDQSAANATGNLYIVAVQNGVLTINSGFECHQVIGAISQADVLEAKDRVSSEGVYDTFGAGFFDNLKAMVSKAIPYVKSGAKLAHAGLNMADKAGLLGSGYDEKSMYGGSALSGGGAYTGGAKLSKKDLAHRLR